MTESSQIPDPAEPSEPAKKASIQGVLARTTIGVGVFAAAMAMIAKPDQTLASAGGAFVGALAIMVLIGPPTERSLGRVIDHIAGMGDEQWRKLADTGVGRVISRLAAGRLTSMLVSIPIFVAGVGGAQALATEGATVGNVGMAMAGAAFYLTAQTVLDRFKRINMPEESPPAPRPPTRMR